MTSWVATKTEVGKAYWERADGAYVWYCDNRPDPNPANPRSRMWIAFDCNGTYLVAERRNTRMCVPRSWVTPQAAMKALDKERPLEIEASDGE